MIASIVQYFRFTNSAFCFITQNDNSGVAPFSTLAEMGLNHDPDSADSNPNL